MKFELVVSMMDLRALCIRHNWCDRMDNDQYTNLLELSRYKVDVVIRDMATMIVHGTSKYIEDFDYSEDYADNLAYVMTEILHISRYKEVK